MNRSPFFLAVASAVVFTTVCDLRAQPLRINTLAGYAAPGSNNGTGSAARFNNPSSVAVDSVGNLYVADTANHTIRQITPFGVASTLAGVAGVSGSADSTNGIALFNQPQGVAVDAAGNVYVADTGNQTIRKITSGGVVSTLAGLAGYSGSANGSGNGARFYQPEGVAVDAGTNVYVADTWNHTIRKITPAGVVSTLAGSAGSAGSTDGTGSGALFYQPQGVAVDSVGNVYVADTGNQTIRMITSGGAVSTLAGLAGNYGSVDATGANARFYGPAGVSVDGLGNVYVADYFNQTLRMVTPSGAVSTVAGLAGSYGSADGTGTMARFWGPMGVAAMGTNTVTVYVADAWNGTIRAITAGGVVSTLAGSASTGSTDAPGSAARFFWPRGAAVDSATNVYVADTQNGTIRKVTPAGIVSTLAGSPGNFGSADGSGANAQFYGPQGASVDSSGTLFVADTANGTIRKVTSGGVVSTVAGSPGNYGNADGTGSNARFNQPQGVAADSFGNVYVADTLNHTIRKIFGGNLVVTLAGVSGSAGSTDGTGSNVGTNTARFNNPMGVAVDAAGNVYVADTYNHTIRMVTQFGVVSTLAGLPGVWGNIDGTNSAARFYEPTALAVDSANNVYVLDSGNQTIRKISPVGANWVVKTVAGAAGLNGSSDGASSGAQFNYPGGVAVDNGGLLYVADTGNNTVRRGSSVANGPPFIVTQPQNQEIDRGSNATFAVEAYGVAPLGYQWRLNQVEIPGATGSSYVRTNVQGGDLGSYSVVLTNPLGSLTSADALLFFTTPPSIVGQPQSQTIVPGQNATFTVMAAGTQPLSYQWQLNGSAIPGATATSFTLISAQRTNAGAYSVFVTNYLGTALSDYALLSFVPLQAWGDNTFGQLGDGYTPVTYNVIAVASGAWHNLALQAGGGVVAWGDDSDGQIDVPLTLQPALAIAAGGYHSLAIQVDGTVAAWGANNIGQTNVPPGLTHVMGIAAGTWHSLALRRNGTVVAWGDNSLGQTNVPAGLSNVVAVAAGGNHSLALRSDGTVVAWGDNWDAQGNPVGQSIVPVGLTNVVAIAAGDYHSLAVRANGSVVAWGDNSQGQSAVPVGLTNVVAVAGGGAHTLALRNNGTVAAWGANFSGQCNLPFDLIDVVGLGAGEYHSLALHSGTLPAPQLFSPVRQAGQFSVLLQTLYRKSYALDYKDSVTATNWTGLSTNAGNGALRLLSDPSATAPLRFYRMRQW